MPSCTWCFNLELIGEISFYFKMDSMKVIEMESGDSYGISGTSETPQGIGTMAKNTTSCGNALVTNILFARGGLLPAPWKASA